MTQLISHNSTESRSAEGSSKGLWRLLGPAFVAAVAYVDPGNVAANLSAGADYGYLLVWVLVLANAMAVIVQYLSAKLGIVTGKSLPELLGERLPRTKRLLFWAQAELVAVATDLAEIIGGALALHILFGIYLFAGGIIIGCISLAILVSQRQGQQSFEKIIMALVVIITFGFVCGLFASPPDWLEVAKGVIPRFTDTGSVLIATSMLGATVMPHAVYLHSSLVRDRHGSSTDLSRIQRLLRASRYDVVLALVVAGSVNIAMLLLAAGALPNVEGVDTIDGAANAISAHLGPAIGVIFAVGLLASGLASTSIGCYAGAEIMKGLLKIRISLITRRLITMAPALIILAVGLDPTASLVISQVILSFGIPFAIIPLIHLTSQSALMGQFKNPIILKIIGIVVSVVIIALNLMLIWLVFTGAS